MPSAEIAVIIVNYRTARLALEAVESVLMHDHGGRAVEIHLVDNASPGDDAARLDVAHRNEGWGDTVHLHLEEINHGFGRGNNVVLEALAMSPTPPDKVLLLNPDARLANETIAVLAEFLDSHPEAGAAGAAISLPDGTPVTAAFRFPSFASEFERTVNFGPVSRMLSRQRVPLPPDLATQRVDWVAGAAVMFRLQALRAAGFFDPAYFLYFEEIDLMRNMARRGWQTWFVAEAQAVHHEGAATGVATADVRARRPAYVYESWRHYFEKNHGRGYALATAGAALVGAGIGFGIARLRGREPATPRGFWSDLVRHAVCPMLRAPGASSLRDLSPETFR
jgi:GT2 family glycosyltransferase